MQAWDRRDPDTPLVIRLQFPGLFFCSRSGQQKENDSYRLNNSKAVDHSPVIE